MSVKINKEKENNVISNAQRHGEKIIRNELKKLNKMASYMNTTYLQLDDDLV